MKNFDKIKYWDSYSKFHILNSVKNLSSLIKSKKSLTIIDVGANSGTFFDALRENFEIEKAILFEPHPELYQYLVEKYKNEKNIIVENLALSDSTKKYNLDDSAFQWYLERTNEESFNLGLSKVKYSESGEKDSVSFDEIRYKYNLNKIDLLKIDTETEDLLVLKGFTETITELSEKPIIEFECNWWEKYDKESSQKILNDFCKKCKYQNDIDIEIRGDFYLLPENLNSFSKNKINIKKNKVTIVTGLWDLGRGNMDGWAKRSFQHYKDRFFELLACDANLAIWIPREFEEEVWKIRDKSKNNTKIYHKELKDFETWFPFWKELQKIRTDESWKNFAGWLPESPQAALEYYNPMMMCKMFMVNDTAINNPFGSKYFYWIDGGLTNTVDQGYFSHHNVFEKLPEYTDNNKKFIMLSYPYEANEEIHGFERKAMAKYCNTDFVKYVCRGGFWGGKKEVVHKMNDEYYSILKETITNGYMGADECLFTILAHKHPKEIHRFELEANGLCGPFFENLRNYTPPETEDFVIKKEFDDKVAYIQTKEDIEMNNRGEGVNFYIVTFNSPPQLQLLLDTIEQSNPELLVKTNKYLINNSIDRSTDKGYDDICSKYGFTQFKEGNLGVCGARQWAAKHFHESNSKYIIWFEDDMLMENKTKLCKNGLNMHCDNWVEKCMEIIENEHLDFIKISFSEFYGDHHEQWSWYNIPIDVKQKYFPTGEHKMKFETSGVCNGLAYLIGEVYYSNWPSVMTKAGNYKIFLETPYAHPYEQTMMSHCFQLTKKGRIRSAVLMASLVNHNRVYHYSKEIRKEC